MRVIVNDHVYEMSKKSLDGLLNVSSRLLTFGIYAVKKNNFCELKNELCQTQDELNKKIDEYQKQGFKVYFNDQGKA